MVAHTLKLTSNLPCLLSPRLLHCLPPWTFDHQRHYLSSQSRVAVLYQACEPPVINRVRKPKKPGGYRDSGADIAYALKSQDVDVVTPERNPDPQSDEGWCFPDTERGILTAIEEGATTLWANTILFASHPLQTLIALDECADRIRIVGQAPRLVEQFDDKDYVNALLRSRGIVAMPKSWTIDASSSLDLATLPYPIVAKPIRGRGSHGVKVCKDEKDLSAHLLTLYKDSPIAMLEEYLPGREGTITVMPPSNEVPRYWALPIVVRFNHEDGIAPYNGIVAVTSNSRVPSEMELKGNSHYQQIASECEQVAKFLRVTAPIRVDVRCFGGTDSRFAAFDVNMKPNMTGPGRPGREKQASLTAMAAASLGWDYPQLLVKILDSASTLQHLRGLSV